MVIKGLNECDVTNYKKASMFVIFPYCTFKCEKEFGECCCQNSALSKCPSIEISAESIVDRYMSNPMTSAIVCGGLEPMDSFGDLYNLILSVRSRGCLDDIVIYTGYNKDELEHIIRKIAPLRNIIIKFGRYIPFGKPHKDSLLGVELASDNQYAERIS